MTRRLEGCRRHLTPGFIECPSPCSGDIEPVNVAVMNSSRQERRYPTDDPNEVGRRLVSLIERYEAAGADCALIAFSLVEEANGLRTDLVFLPLMALIATRHRLRT